jgi:GH35 family endo-1,4-beta-xylanase
VAAAVAGLVVASGSPAAAASLPTPGKDRTFAKVPASFLGMHDHTLTDTPPATDHRFGGVRLWDNGVRWDEINPTPDVYNWDALNQAVANARATGAKDVMYVLGYTPNWAADFVKPPCTPGVYTGCSYYTTGSGAKPKNIEDWKKWVGTVAAKYKGKITQYQIWNEANLTSFFETPNEDSALVMAALTKAAEDVIRSVDRDAKVITASSTIIQNKKFVRSGWLKRYLVELKRLGSKPDGIAVHTYPWLKQGPGNGTIQQRSKGVALAEQVVDAAGYGDLPMLDTEMNYGNQRENNWPKKKYSQDQGAAYLAQTYLDSLHNGVVQVDWYGWDDYGLGIWTTDPGTGAVLKPGKAYATLLKNLPGSKVRGCTVQKTLTVCLTTKGKKNSYYVYRPVTKKKTYSVPASFKVRKACDVFDKCTTIRGGKVKVGQSPLRLTR